MPQSSARAVGPATQGRAIGLALIIAAASLALAAPVVAPHSAERRFAGLINAPPTRPHVLDDTGGWHAPFIYRWRLVNQLEQRYDEDRSTRVGLRWFVGGAIVQSADETTAPLLLLGSDSFGRDVFSRVVVGGRLSLALALTAAIGATILGGLAGGVAGYMGGALDETLMRAADFVLVLPAVYVALALRAVLPLVLGPGVVFALLGSIFALLGAPSIAQSVRAVVRSERRSDYASAAEAAGASDARVLVRHLLPAARGVVAVELTMLVPAFVVAEATLSYVGLGFPDPIASWGTMLHDAANVSVFADRPWLLSPAVAMFVVVLALNLVLQGRTRSRLV